MSWFSKALKSAGKGITAVTGTVKKGASAVKSIPVVGKPISAAYGVTVGPQFEIADAVAKGKRVDKAAYEGLKAAVKGNQEAAPYVQKVAPLIPGVGSGVAGAIGAANALSKGKPLNAAIVDGFRSMVPGGFAGQAAFDVAFSMSSGGSVSPAIAKLPISESQKHALASALIESRAAANGQGNPNAIVNADRVIRSLSPEIRNAIVTGIAVSRAQNLQKIAQSETQNIGENVAAPGLNLIQQNPVLLAGLDILNNSEAKAGYVLAVGLMTFKLNETALFSAEKSLRGVKLAGFEFGVSLYTGITTFNPPTGMTESERVGWFSAKGMRGAGNATKARVAGLLASHKGALSGAKKARNVWERFVEALGF